MGHSGGGPYTLACGALLPEHVLGVVSVAGLAPLGASGLYWFAGMTDSMVASLRAAAQLPPGTGPRHLVFHPAGSHAYVLGELEPTVTVCRWDAATGVLEPVGATPLFPDGDGAVSPSAPVVSHSGRHLWAAVRGTDTIAVLALDAVGGQADLIASVPCGGRWPRDLVLDPSGTRLYVANEHSGDVTWLDIDSTTGIPHRAGSLSVPAASNVVFA